MGTGRLCASLREKLKMNKGDPEKPRGKMSSYAFFGLICQRGKRRSTPML
jgi:hypothetical protein